MKIAVVSEISAVDKNLAIVEALEGRNHTVYNLGMKNKNSKFELSYIHTGFLSALLLNIKKVDLVVGGCGTGQGYLNSVMQYPNVFCGHILNSLDAWLFTQINGGNCISLALNQGYGWAGDVNLNFIFDRLFSVEKGSGYPPHRQLPQKESRELLENISSQTHVSLSHILNVIPDQIILPVLSFPGVIDFIDIDNLEDNELKEILKGRI